MATKSGEAQRCWLEVKLTVLAIAVGLLTAVLCGGCTTSDNSELLNVSYDPTRELWKDINSRFTKSVLEKHGRELIIRQSHGGSSSQARAVIDGLHADVVTLATSMDIDEISKKGLIAPEWRTRLPNNSLPFYSTIVFVVRKGNPKGVRDWPDLLKPDISIVTPNPKTSGNGKLSLLAAWGAALARGESNEKARDFIKELYRKVPVLDTGARAATATFAQKNIGDVHLTWENEAHLEIKEAGGALEIVYPSVSIKADPSVAVVDKVVDGKGTRKIAEEYLSYLYTDEAQEIIAKHSYRPNNDAVRARFAPVLPDIKLFTIEDIAGSWEEAQKLFFADGALFDSVYEKSPS